MNAVRASGLKRAGYLLLACFLAPALAGSSSDSPAPTHHANVQTGDLPTIEVSLVTIDPQVLRPTGHEEHPVATVTVQLAHMPLATDERVSLNVGTYSSDPAGIAVTYDPASQIVHVPPGPQGVVAVKAQIKKVQIVNGTDATFVVAATITKPTAGIRVIHDDPALSTHQAHVTVKGTIGNVLLSIIDHHRLL